MMRLGVALVSLSKAARVNKLALDEAARANTNSGTDLDLSVEDTGAAMSEEELDVMAEESANASWMEPIIAPAHWKAKCSSSYDCGGCSYGCLAGLCYSTLGSSWQCHGLTWGVAHYDQFYDGTYCFNGNRDFVCANRDYTYDKARSRHKASKCRDRMHDCCASEEWGETPKCGSGYEVVKDPKCWYTTSGQNCMNFKKRGKHYGNVGCYGCFPPGAHRDDHGHHDDHGGSRLHEGGCWNKGCTDERKPCSWCGGGMHCCRKDWSDKYGYGHPCHDAIFGSGVSGHQCVRPRSSGHSRLHEGGCWAKGCQDGATPCSWCGTDAGRSLYCCRKDWAHKYHHGHPCYEASYGSSATGHQCVARSGSSGSCRRRRDCYGALMESENNMTAEADDGEEAEEADEPMEVEESKETEEGDDEQHRND